MNYNKFDAAPFCPHFFNCKKLHDKEHKKKYMHPCVKGKSCDQLNSKYHTRFWYHFDLPTCPHGSACQQICDPKHRSEFHHEAKKGEHAIRDYMLNCDHCENCIIEDRVHAMTFQHIRPFVFPQDGIVPEFVPDHKDKMCKVCHNKERECSCVYIPQSPRPHSPESCTPCETAKANNMSSGSYSNNNCSEDLGLSACWPLGNNNLFGNSYGAYTNLNYAFSFPNFVHYTQPSLNHCLSSFSTEQCPNENLIDMGYGSQCNFSLFKEPAF